MDLRTYMFGGTTRQIVYKSLDAGAMRNRTIAQNLANATTPGYQRKEISFEDQLKNIMEVKLRGKRTDPEHIEISQAAMLRRVRPLLYEPRDPTLPGEINNVDVDLEAAKLAENQILYDFAIKFAGFDKYNAAITGNASQ